MSFSYEVVGYRPSAWVLSCFRVSVIGLLRPLLVTYQTQSAREASHLRLLQAIQWESAIDTAGLNQIIEGTVSWEDLNALGEDLIPRDVIRGSLDVRSLIMFRVADWCWHKRLGCVREANQAKLRRWWMQCMPIPAELRSAEFSPRSQIPTLRRRVKMFVSIRSS